MSCHSGARSLKSRPSPHFHIWVSHFNPIKYDSISLCLSVCPRLFLFMFPLVCFHSPSASSHRAYRSHLLDFQKAVNRAVVGWWQPSLLWSFGLGGRSSCQLPMLSPRAELQMIEGINYRSHWFGFPGSQKSNQEMPIMSDHLVRLWAYNLLIIEPSCLELRNNGGM